MKILCIHHYPIPTPEHPVAGGSIRIASIIKGLRHHKHSIVSLCKQEISLSRSKLATAEQTWREQIHSAIESDSPDIIFCGQLEDVSLLPETSIPIVVDLYAPRLLEMAFDQLGRVGLDILSALQKADMFLLSAHEQRHHWMSLFALAGVDIRTVPYIVVPLSIDTVSKRAIIAQDTTPIFVGGGRIWPWESPLQTLQELLHKLDLLHTGLVRWFAPPDVAEFPIKHPRLIVHPWTSRENYQEILATSHVGLDLNPPSMERELATAFRHMEYLGQGLVIFSSNHNILSNSHPVLCRYMETPRDIQSMWDDVLEDQDLFQQELEQFQQSRRPENTVADLQNWLCSPCKRPQQCPSPLTQVLLQWQTVENAKEELAHRTQTIAVLEKELACKKQEIDIANQRLEQSSASVLQLASAIEHMSSFKNHITHSMVEQNQQQQDHIQALHDQIAIVQADNAKKSAELVSMDQLRARLENDVAHLRQEIETNKSRWFRRQ